MAISIILMIIWFFLYGLFNLTNIKLAFGPALMGILAIGIAIFMALGR